MSQTMIDPEIFKAYDIRGIYPSGLNETIAHRIGQAFALLIKKESDLPTVSVVVSRDMRLSSPQLHQAVTRGIIDQGVNIVDIGLASTPTFYFAVGYLGLQGGIQVSASHNPSEWNGFKMVRAKGVPISGETGIYAIRDQVIANQFLKAESIGSVKQYDSILNDLVEQQSQGFDLKQLPAYKVVADAANAMGILDLTAIFGQLPSQLIPLNFELDGTFPSHEADPLKDENLQLLKQKVVEHKADFGIATDGDGDRLFVVDDKGQTLPPEILRGILAQMVLRQFPGCAIGYDIRPGRITRDMIEEAGGKPFMTRVGHSLIKEEMLKRDSAFAGESSGHFFFQSDQGSFESPTKAILYLMQWLQEQQTSLSKAVVPYKKYFHSGEINSTVEDAQAVFEKLKNTYKNATNFSDLDGVLFEFPTYWFNVRASNTEPKMRLNLEATTKEEMELKRDEVLAVIRNHSN